ncbi:hypothetical protein GGR56DRAFT_195687 [Xylariaceae sp. FL0804]|nr:hypothetical protein GGR56DRAFT_195687 [Xylariaceae sp. FL0804]
MLVRLWLISTAIEASLSTESSNQLFQCNPTIGPCTQEARCSGYYTSEQRMTEAACLLHQHTYSVHTKPRYETQKRHSFLLPSLWSPRPDGPPIFTSTMKVISTG